jgi:hypothetical protein
MPGRARARSGPGRARDLVTGLTVDGGLHHNQMPIRGIFDPALHRRGSVEPAVRRAGPGDGRWRSEIRSFLASLLAQVSSTAAWKP